MLLEYNNIGLIRKRLGDSRSDKSRDPVCLDIISVSDISEMWVMPERMITSD